MVVIRLAVLDMSASPQVMSKQRRPDFLSCCCMPKVVHGAGQQIIPFACKGDMETRQCHTCHVGYDVYIYNLADVDSEAIAPCGIVPDLQSPY